MRTKEVIKYIKEWILQYNKESKTKGFVIGISGGIDSALTSTLIAETRLPLLCIEMPIHQNKKEILTIIARIEKVFAVLKNFEKLILLFIIS